MTKWGSFHVGLLDGDECIMGGEKWGHVLHVGIFR